MTSFPLIRTAARAAALAALFLSSPALAGAAQGSLGVSATVMCGVSTSSTAPRPDWAQASGGAVLTCPEGAHVTTSREAARQPGTGLAADAAMEQARPSAASGGEAADGTTSFVTITY